MTGPSLLLSDASPCDREPSRRRFDPPPRLVLYLAIPAHNEVATIGVLLWRLRTVLAEFPREYEVVVYDDASDDETADVAEQYLHAMPVTVLRGTTPVGYAGAVDALVRHIAAQTRYPRRDAMLLLQGDFTDPPGIVPEFARRFEGGADLVIGERTAVVDAPVPVRRLFTAAGWALRPFVRVAGVRDLTGSMRLVRISALRDLLRTAGDAPVCEGDSWTANADLLLRLIPHARRVETVPVEPTYGVRTRDTRRVTVRDALAALRWGWRARGRNAQPSSAPEPASESTPRHTRSTAPQPRRRDEAEVTVDKLRERSKERERLRGDAEPSAPRSRRDGRPDRERSASRSAEPRDMAADPVKEARRESAAEDERKASRSSNRRNEPRRDESRRDEPRRDDARRDDARRDETRPPRTRVAPPIDDASIFDDPFANPATRNTPVPYPAELTAPPGFTLPFSRSLPTPQPPAPPVPPPAKEAKPTPKASNSAASEADSGRDLDDGDDMDDANDSASDSPESGGDSTTSESRERKRRRNRRSRRRRSKARGENTEATGATEQDSDSDNVDASAAPRSETNDKSVARPAPQRAREPLDETSDETADDASNDDGDDASDGAEGESDSADASQDAARSSRAKRRGRRGRRGGMRRSRGRGREGSGDQGGESGGGDASASGDGAGGEGA